jgi:hypothetical protein
MHGTTGTVPTLAKRFGAFVTERYPFALSAALAALDRIKDGSDIGAALRAQLSEDAGALSALGDTIPGVSAPQRHAAAIDELVAACEGFFRRAEIRASLSAEERREILRGLVLTRATDNRLKAFFLGGEVRYGDGAFQGKGFRSLGQEAIYAAGIRLRRGD